MNAKRFKFTAKSLLMMAFGSASGYSLASLMSSSLLETDKSFKKNLAKIVPNKVRNPRRIQIERKTDPNDFYLEQKEQEQKMQSILQGLQSENKITQTQQQLQKYHLRKNFIYGLIAGAMGSLINRRLMGIFAKRSLPVYLSIPISAPIGILVYYGFSGTFDNMGPAAVIDKFTGEAPVLICVKFAVDAFRMFVRQMSRDANIINMNLLQKAKAEKVDPKTVRMVRVHPIYSLTSTALLLFWFVFLISVFEERVEADFSTLVTKLTQNPPREDKDK